MIEATHGREHHISVRYFGCEGHDEWLVRRVGDLGVSDGGCGIVGFSRFH